jgi:hypothetical protein
LELFVTQQEPLVLRPAKLPDSLVRTLRGHLRRKGVQARNIASLWALKKLPPHRIVDGLVCARRCEDVGDDVPLAEDEDSPEAREDSVMDWRGQGKM